MNLREFCRLPNFQTAVVTTYNIDPLFFERVVLFDLVSGGASRILVLCDERQAMPVIMKARGQLVALGKRYRLVPVRMKGSFHPKVCIRIGRDQALVACGSHNLTRSGWLGTSPQGEAGGNRESTVVWRVVPGTPAASDLHANLNILVGSLEFPEERDEFYTYLRTTWLGQSQPDILPSSDRSWIVVGLRHSLASILERRWQGRRFERLRIVTGSTDYQAAMVRWASATFGISEAVVEVDRTFCSFDPVALADLPVSLRIRPYDGHPRTHLKVALFESRTGSAAVVGSANCSGSAWLWPPTEGGNIESVVIYDNCEPSDLARLFRSDQGEAAPWQSVPLACPPPEDKTPSLPHLCLRRLQIRRSRGEFTATFESPPGVTGVVLGVVQTSRVPLQATQEPRVWRGALPDITDEPETLFGHVEIQRDGSMEVTNTVWIDDMDRLAEAASRHLRFDAVRRLASVTLSGEYKRLLEDLHVLSETLLCKPFEFPDVSTLSPRKEEKSENKELPKPVTATDILRNLEQLSTHHGEVPLVLAQVGTVSLTGIMRILFADDVSGIDIDPTEAEHKKSIEEEERDEEDQSSQAGEPPNTVTIGPTPAQRRRLIEQLNLFVDRFSQPSFADTCSARQLQQAAAYPLAVAQFAARGPWMDPGDRAQLAEIVRRACEFLFYCRRVETDSRTGTHRVRPPLIEEVRGRYTEQGRAPDFDQIIGDGTLWLVVIRALAMMGEQPGRRFARNLALCDVARYDLLSSTAVAENLAPLVSRLWRNSDADVAGQINRLVVAFDALGQYIGKHFEEWRLNLVSYPLAGDWLWKPQVGFAQIIELSDSGKAKVHLRRRAETILVVLSYYVNLREVSRHDDELALRLAACSE